MPQNVSYIYAGDPGELQSIGVCVVLKYKIQMKQCFKIFKYWFIFMMFSTYKVVAAMVTGREVACNPVWWTLFLTDMAQVKKDLCVWTETQSQQRHAWKKVY